VVPVEEPVLTAGEHQAVAPGGMAAQVLVSSFATQSGSGTVRVRPPIGLSMTSRLRTILTRCSTRSRRRRNSTSRTRGPKTSPWRSPDPAATTASARYRLGRARSRRGPAGRARVRPFPCRASGDGRSLPCTGCGR
jgi:hypothetical protein